MEGKDLNDPYDLLPPPSPTLQSTNVFQRVRLLSENVTAMPTELQAACRDVRYKAMGASVVCGTLGAIFARQRRLATFHRVALVTICFFGADNAYFYSDNAVRTANQVLEWRAIQEATERQTAKREIQRETKIPDSSALTPNAFQPFQSELAPFPHDDPSHLTPTSDAGGEKTTMSYEKLRKLNEVIGKL